MQIEYIGNVLYDKKILHDDRKLIIFGCGVQGKKLFEYLVKQGVKENIVCFCDTNSSLTNESINGVPIYTPKEACQNYPEADYLIGGKYSQEMYACLKMYQIKKIHLIV